MSLKLLVSILAKTPTGYRLPAGAIILWHGLVGDIPEKFSKFAAAADSFIQGATSGAATTSQAGSETHAHTTPATGDAGSHNHTYSDDTNSAGWTNAYLQSTGDEVAPQGHDHDISGTTNTRSAHHHTVPSTGSANHLPPYHRLYYIQADENVLNIPVGCIIGLKVEPAILGADWQICDGSNGTPDLRDKFVYAADVDGEVDLTGGASSHYHALYTTLGSGEHSHSISGTSDTETESAAPNKAATYGDVWLADSKHTHTWSDTTSSESDHTHSLGDTNSVAAEPPFKKLYYVMRIA